jgi:hypothetical protein
LELKNVAHHKIDIQSICQALETMRLKMVHLANNASALVLAKGKKL